MSYLKKSALLLLLIFGALPLHAKADATDDTVVIEFTETAKNFAEALKKLGNVESCMDGAVLSDLVENTDHTSSPLVFIRGTEHDARNWTDEAKKTHIELSRMRMAEMSDSRKYVNLMIHEYMGLLRLEGTNETRLSQQCLKNVLSKGTSLKDLVYRISPITQVEEDFISKKIYFECTAKKASGNEKAWRVYYANESQEKLRSNRIIIAKQKSNGDWKYIAGSRLHFGSGYNADTVRELFSSDYELETGKGSTHFNLKDMSEGNYQSSFEMITENHTDWNFRLMIRDRAIDATCSPSLTGGINPEFE